MSIFESFNDKNLINYLKYLFKKDILNDDSLSDFYENVITDYDSISKIILAPLSKKDLDRLDIEYLYELLSNNNSESLNEGIIYRPELKTQSVEFVSEERQWVQYTREEDVETYSDLDHYYLNQLHNHDELSPWDWEITDEDIQDSDTNDWWFEV